MFVCGNAEKNSHFNVTFKVVNFENALKWMQNLEKVKLFLNKWSNKWGNMKANKKKIWERRFLICKTHEILSTEWISWIICKNIEKAFREGFLDV